MSLHEIRSEVSPSLLRAAADKWENQQSELEALRVALDGRNKSVEKLSEWLNDTEEKLRNAMFELDELRSANADGRHIIVPCKVGDMVWGIRTHKAGTESKAKPVLLPVHEMYFIEGMRLCIVLKGCCRGEWGKAVFGNEEDAWAVIYGGKADGQ